MLTPYDEFPVHQAPYPFSYIPSTDYSWDDGYYFGAFSAEDGVFLATGARINPNTDMIGGYVLFNIKGFQHTVRFNRCWRRNFNVEIGPWKVEFVEPMKKIRLTMAENGSGISYDILWEGTSIAFEEDHHVATNRGRRTTDQTRYSQAGNASGWIKCGDEQWDVTPDRWHGSRDHSWGLYAERPPLAPPAALLPPRDVSEGPQRAMRFWAVFDTPPFSGFFHLHETADGVQCKMNDVFGTPFGGHMFEGWDTAIDLEGGTHDIDFQPGTRIMKEARIELTGKDGQVWKLLFEVTSPPWVVHTMGYFPGSWKDGGTFFTYHGSEELAIEWDAFDFSEQPVEWTPYAVKGEGAAIGNFGIGDDHKDKVQGPEYLCRVTVTAPDGRVGVGAAQVEMFLNGPHHRYAMPA